MARTKIVAEIFLPTTSLSRVQDFIGDMISAIDRHKGGKPFVTISGPHLDNGEVTNGEEQGSKLGRAADAAGNPGNGSGDNGTGAGVGGDSGGEPVKRRGRPPGSGKAGKGPSEEGRGTDDASRARSSEGTRDDEPVRTREGSDEGSAKGGSGSGGSGGSRNDQRGDSEAAGLDEGWDEASSGDEWGDDNPDDENDEEWHAKTPGHEIPDRFLPKEIDKATVQTLLADHYKATGGKDRGPTFDLMDDAVGSKQLSNVSEADYKKLAKALIKDTWRYKFGIKKAK